MSFVDVNVLCAAELSAVTRRIFTYTFTRRPRIYLTVTSAKYSLFTEKSRKLNCTVFIRDEAVDGHCFIEFKESENAVKALELEKKFKTELILGKYSLKFRH